MYRPDLASWHGHVHDSPLCAVRGGYVNWMFTRPTQGGPDDRGFLRVCGATLSVAPHTVQPNEAIWDSGLFTYDDPEAGHWRFDLYVRDTAVLVGDGRADYTVELLDADGDVVATAHPDKPMPPNAWVHRRMPFDGSKLLDGARYRIRITITVPSGETGANFGIDVAHVETTASYTPATTPSSG